MKNLRVLMLITSMLAGLSSSPAMAQNPVPQESLQAARELASLSSANIVSQLVTNLTEQVWPQVEAALRVKNPNIDAATLRELRTEFERLQTTALLEGQSDSAPIYARYFTAQEMRELATFYRTPLGAKAMALMPYISLEMVRGQQPRMQMLSANVNMRFATILQQRGYSP